MTRKRKTKRKRRNSDEGEKKIEGIEREKGNARGGGAEKRRR